MNATKNNKARELNYTGIKLLKEGKPKEALECFEQAIEYGGDMLIKSWSNKGLALKELSRFDESIECFDKALSIETEMKSMEEDISSDESEKIDDENRNEILEQLDLSNDEIASDPDDIEELCRRLDEINEFDPVRIEIIDTLAGLKSPKSVPSLLKALNTDYAIGRDKIALLLGEMKVMEAIPVFIRLLQEDSGDELRISCARVLGELASEEAVEVLIDVLEKDTSQEVKDEVFSALEVFSEDKRVKFVLEKHKKNKVLLKRIKVEEDIEKVIFDFDDDILAEKILIEALKDEDREDFNIIRALGYLKSQKAVEPLIRVLKDRQNPSHVRCSAALVLGNMADKKISDSLLKLLKDNDKSVRSSVAEALGKLGEKRAVEPLIKSLNRALPEFKEKILEALCRIRYLPPLIKALEDKRDSIRLPVIEVLSSIKGNETRKAVFKLVDNKDRVIRNTGLKILCKIGAYRELISVLNDGICASKAVELLSSAEDNSDGELSQLLIEALHSSDEEIRGNAVEILGVRQAKDARKSIKNLLDDPVEKVVFQTIDALARMEETDTLIKFAERKKEFTPKVIESIGLYGEEKDYDLLVNYLKDENSLVRAEAVLGLGRIECHRATKDLLDILKDTDEKVRSNACWALGKLSDEKVVEPLCRMLQDKNPSVRKSVKVSLEQLCLENDLKDLVISNLNKISSFSLTSLFSKEKKIARKEATELLETIQVLEP